LEIILKSNDVRLDHLEDSKTAVQAEFPWLRHKVILSLVPQNE